MLGKEVKIHKYFTFTNKYTQTCNIFVYNDFFTLARKTSVRMVVIVQSFSQSYPLDVYSHQTFATFLVYVKGVLSVGVTKTQCMRQQN